MSDFLELSNPQYQVNDIQHGDFNDLVDLASRTPEAMDASSNASTENPSSYTWDMNTGYNQSLELLKNGWQDESKLRTMQQRSEAFQKKLQDLESQAPRVVYDYSGDEIEIGRYLSHEPESFINFRLDNRRKAIRLICDIGGSCVVTSDQFLARGSAIIGLCRYLESNGYATEILAISCCKSVKSPTKKQVSCFTIKEAHEYYNYSRLLFLLVHPAAFRRIFFRVYEHNTEQKRRYYGWYVSGSYGYGFNAFESFTEKDKQNSIYFPFLSSGDYNSDDYTQSVSEVASKTMATGQGGECR